MGRFSHVLILSILLPGGLLLLRSAVRVRERAIREHYPVGVTLHRSQYFPVILLLCNVAAAVLYASSGDWRRSLYWLASSVCIATVTF